MLALPGPLPDAPGGHHRHGPCLTKNQNPKGDIMIWTIALILLVLWVLGLVTSTTLGGFVHVLLVLAIIVLLFRVIQGRRV